MIPSQTVSKIDDTKSKLIVQSVGMIQRADQMMSHSKHPFISLSHISKIAVPRIMKIEIT